jgi:chondroitin AC lyase
LYGLLAGYGHAQTQPGTNAKLLLKHSVGSLAHCGKIDVPLIYADYYLLEAMLRWSRRK